MSAIYRVRQFVRAAGAWVRPEDAGEAVVSRYLPLPAAELFGTMPRYDRQHALSVVRTLQERGQIEPDLLAAALLHDVGKTAQRAGRLRLWHRVAVVLMHAFRPGLLERIAEAGPGGWRRPFFVQQHHAAIGAELAEKAGCSPRAVELICRHEEPPGQTDDPLLAALHAADSAN